MILRALSGAVATIFFFCNLYAVRHSVVSLVLPRRVANIEIGEEVPSRYLLLAVITMSLLFGILLAFPQDDWTSLALVRWGRPFARPTRTSSTTSDSGCTGSRSRRRCTSGR